jgi:hypothetical protein
MRRLRLILALLAILAFGVSIQPSSFEPLASQDLQIKWHTKTIKIALSSSLTDPSANMSPGADVLGAVERALKSWSSAANIKFVVTHSKVQSISAATQGDGINLITIAPTSENLAIFNENNNAARTRVFYDRETGEIAEADIVINPFPYSDNGELLQFSTDGTTGTYDLESTVAHEIGHLLGLNHSAVIGATMNASQGLNGTFGRPAHTERTLSDVDLTAARHLYGPCENPGSVKGRILNSTQGSLIAAAGAHVWIEDLSTGRVIGSTLTNNRGEFSIGCVPAGDYRAMVEYTDLSLNEQFGRDKQAGRKRQFRSSEINSSFRVDTERTSMINYILVPPQNGARSLQPRFFGTNGDLSTIPLTAAAGSRLTIYIEGPGVDLVPGNGFVASSPFITIDADSLSLQKPRDSAPVVSFDVILAPNVPPGDYSLRLQSNSGELAYLVGAVTVEPASK